MTETANESLLTANHVRRWVEERDALAREYGILRQKIHAVQQKLDALALLLPEDVVTSLIGTAPSVLPNEPARFRPEVTRRRPYAQTPLTDLIVEVARGERGGRTSAWFRRHMSNDPELKARIDKNPTGVSNALSRLVDRDLLLRADGRYYYPAVLRKIQSGEIEEEHEGNDSGLSFNSVMHDVMRKLGKPFTAAEAIAAAKENDFLAGKLKEQSNRVYGWLSRELFKNKLVRDGELYSYPSERDEALNGNADSASIMGEGATSLFKNQKDSPTG